MGGWLNGLCPKAPGAPRPVPCRGHRGGSHCLQAAPLPAAQAQPEANCRLRGGRSQRGGKGGCPRTLTSLASPQWAWRAQVASAPSSDRYHHAANTGTTATALRVTLGIGTNLLDSPVNLGWPTALSAILRPL